MLKEKGINPRETPKARYSRREGQNWFGEYFEALQNSFVRAWKWRFLWVLGLLLPAAGGFGGSASSRSDEEASEIGIDDSIGSTESYGATDLAANFSFVEFWNEHWIWILGIAAIIIILIAIIWILSSIARNGVIKNLSEIQKTGKSNNPSFKEAWLQGRDGFGKIILLDLLVFALTILAILIFALLLSAIFFLIKNGWIVGILLVALVLSFLIFIIGISYAKRIAIVEVVLESKKVPQSLKSGWKIVKNSKKEVLKAILFGILIGITAVLVSVAILLMTLLVGVLIALPFIALGAFESFSFMTVLGGILIALPAIFALILLVVWRAIGALWTEDFYLWWVKKVGVSGVKTEGNSSV